MSAPAKIPLSSLPRGELEALAERLLAENDALRRAIAELKAEVATLKGVKGRPKLKPSGRLRDRAGSTGPSGDCEAGIKRSWPQEATIPCKPQAAQGNNP